MSDYFGYIVSKPYYKRVVSSIDQYAGARQYCFDDGLARGMRAIDVYTGSGFEFTILPDRGLDIASARFRGVPVAYVSKVGLKNPSICYPDSRGDFLRYFIGGLVSTCGLDNVGEDCHLEGSYYPMHGRNMITPSENLCIRKYWEGNDYFVTVQGDLRFAALFGENITINRSITIKMGENKLRIVDKIVNESSIDQPIMLMYHCNFGFPIASPNSFVISNHNHHEYFDKQSAAMAKDRLKFDEEIPREYNQRTYTLHEPRNSVVKAGVINPEIELGAYVECFKDQLGSFTQWMQLAEQDYVIGLEPGTCNPIGRRRAVEEGRITIIEAGETAVKELTIGLLVGIEEIESYHNTIKPE